MSDTTARGRRFEVGCFSMLRARCRRGQGGDEMDVDSHLSVVLADVLAGEHDKTRFDD